MTTAIYPGSFDPVTNGHADLVHRALEVFDNVIVAVAHNSTKSGLFTIEERLELIEQTFGDPRVSADSFTGLLVDYADRVKSRIVLRGLRAVADFEYEFQMENMNRHLNSNIETLFMMTGPGLFYVSSSLVREVASLGGNIDDLVPPPVQDALAKKFG